MDAEDRLEPALRHPRAPAPGEQLPCHFVGCFGCGEPDFGLHMQLFAGRGVSVRGRFLVTEAHQGAPGLAHGGLISASLDELLGSLNWLLMSPAVTARLEVDFVLPIPVGTWVELHAEVVGVDGRKVYTTGSGRIGDGSGPVAFRGRGLFLQVPSEHFRRHGRPAEVAAAEADRAQHRGPGEPWLEVNP